MAPNELQADFTTHYNPVNTSIYIRAALLWSPSSIDERSHYEAAPIELKTYIQMSENKLIRVVLLWFLSSEDERYQNKTTLIKLSTQLSTVSMQSNASVSLTSKVVSGPSILEEFGTTLRIDSVNPYTWKRACIKTGIVSNDYLPSYEWSENYHLRLFENVSARTLVCWLWERHPLSEIDAFPTIKFEDLRRCCKKRRRRKEEEGEEEGKEKKKKKKEKKRRTY